MTKSIATAPPKASRLQPTQSVLQRKYADSSHLLATDKLTAQSVSVPALASTLVIGATDDPLEAEADRVAEQVLAGPSHSLISPASLKLQRHSTPASTQPMAIPPSVGQTLAGSGSALPGGVRQDMEHRFGHNFSHVRVHSGAAAEQSARDIGANAYTLGNSIVFGSGKFAPATTAGRRLLAHELTHVVQQGQSGGNSRVIQRDPNDDWMFPPKKQPPKMGSKEWVAAFNAGSPEEEKKRQAALAKLMAESNPAIAHAAPAAPADPLKMDADPAKMAEFIRAQQEQQKKDEAARAKAKAAEAEKKRLAAKAEEERTSLGEAGVNDKRRELAGSPVLALQEQLERTFKTKKEIDEFRKLVARLTPEEFFTAFPNMSPDVYLTLHDFGQVGKRDWQNFKPPPADVDAIMRRALKLPADKYLSQAHQDELANAIANGRAKDVAKELGVSPEELERISAYFRSTGRRGVYIDKDPLIMAQGYTGRESGYADFQMRQRLANLEVLANSPFAGIGYGTASIFTDDEQKRMAWAGLGANLEGFAGAAAGVRQGRQTMKDAGQSVSTANQVVVTPPGPGETTGPGGRGPSPAAPGGPINFGQREAGTVFGPRQTPVSGQAPGAENPVVIRPPLSPATPITAAKGSRGMPAGFDKVVPGSRPVTNLADRRAGGKPPSEPASAAVPVAVEQQEQIAVGQTHGAGQRRAPLSLVPNEPTRNSAAEPVVSAPKLLPPGRPTTRTLDQVRKTGGGSQKRGDAGKLHQAEISGGNPQEKKTDTSTGVRFHDVRDEPSNTGVVMRREVKNYSVILSDPNGKPYESSVRVTQHIRDEIAKDAAWVQEGQAKGEYRIVQWDFLGAPPNAELELLLQQNKLPYNYSPSIGKQMMTPKKK